MCFLDSQVTSRSGALSRRQCYEPTAHSTRCAPHTRDADSPLASHAPLNRPCRSVFRSSLFSRRYAVTSTPPELPSDDVVTCSLGFDVVHVGRRSPCRAALGAAVEPNRSFSRAQCGVVEGFVLVRHVDPPLPRPAAFKRDMTALSGSGSPLSSEMTWSRSSPLLPYATTVA